MPRVLVSTEPRTAVLELVRQALDARLDEKGAHSFTSSHEIKGVLDEEYHELDIAIRKNDPQAVLDELLDIAVAAVFGICSARVGGLDW